MVNLTSFYLHIKKKSIINKFYYKIIKTQSQNFDILLIDILILKEILNYQKILIIATLTTKIFIKTKHYNFPTK